jgi:hypothetical protein
MMAAEEAIGAGDYQASAGAVMRRSGSRRTTEDGKQLPQQASPVAQGGQGDQQGNFTVQQNAIFEHHLEAAAAAAQGQQGGAGWQGAAAGAAKEAGSASGASSPRRKKGSSRRPRSSSGSGRSSSDGGSELEVKRTGRSKPAKMEFDTVRGTRPMQPPSPQAAPSASPQVMYLMSQQPMMVGSLRRHLLLP